MYLIFSPLDHIIIYFVVLLPLWTYLLNYFNVCIIYCYKCSMVVLSKKIDFNRTCSLLHAYKKRFTTTFCIRIKGHVWKSNLLLFLQHSSASLLYAYKKSIYDHFCVWIKGHVWSSNLLLFLQDSSAYRPLEAHRLLSFFLHYNYL